MSLLRPSAPANAAGCPGRGGLRLSSAVFLFLLVALLRKMSDFDIWYHLVIGRKIFETLAIPKAEFFVYPLMPAPASFHEWGFGLIYYAVFRNLGFYGMSVVNALVGAGTLFLLFRAARWREAGAAAPVLAALALVPFVEFRLVYRPENFLFLFLAAEILLLERFREEGGFRRLVPLPFLALLLSNVHPSSLILLVVFVAYAADVLATGAAGRRPGVRTAGILVLAGAAMAGAASLNPYGVRQLLLPVLFGSQDALLNRIVEFLPAWETEYRWHFVALAAVGAASLPFSGRKRPADWLLFAAFGFMAFRHVRNIPLLAIVVFVPFAAALGRSLSRLFPAIGVNRGRGVLTWGAVAVAAVAVLVAPVSQGRWGAGPDDRVLPVESAETVRAVRPNGNLLNFYESGGYLAWALYGEYPVFIDGRHYGMDKSWVDHDEIMSAGPSADRLLAGYRVAAVVTRATFPYSGRIIPLVPKLAGDPEWLLARQEPGGLLFLRRGASSDPAKVPAPDPRLVWRQVVHEATRTLDDYPDRAAAWRSLGDAYFMLGEGARAANAYGRVLALDPGNPDAAILRQVVEASRAGGGVSR